MPILKMSYFIIGTAGHVDHGKTALIKALTGIDTDRLPEEKLRGLSIDLGFAHLNLPSGVTAGIVDVPGHERFLKNMLAGVGGYDLALLIIDAVEGIKPQTFEHMEILNLLEIKKGIVVITKVDIAGENRLSLLKPEIKDFFKGTFLEDAQVLEVSSITGRGIEELKSGIDRILSGLPPKAVDAPFRLPVDRVFVKAGFGTVVTGTLLSGTITAGDRVSIQPAGRESKVRQIQVYGKIMEKSFAGQRVALNLSGVNAEEIKRGDVIALPGWGSVSKRIDARLKILMDCPHPVKSYSRIRFYAGTAEILGKIIILKKKILSAGEEGFVQIILDEDLFCIRGDRFLIRSINAFYTIGGGVIVEPQAKPHKFLDEEELKKFESFQEEAPEYVIVSSFERNPLRLLGGEEIFKELLISRKEAEELLKKMVSEKTVQHYLPENKYLLSSHFEELKKKLLEELKKIAKAFPWKAGWKKEEISLNFPGINTKLIEKALESLASAGLIKESKGLFSPAEHKAALPSPLDEVMNKILKTLETSGVSVPEFKTLTDSFKTGGKDLKKIEEFLLQTGQVIRINQEIYLSSSTYESAKKAIAGFITKEGSITPAQCRDLLKTTRKYVIPLLEHLDSIKFTRREQDKRYRFQ